ncbi:hypothetical protein HJD18_16900 [Thermoleophilia bacterium SCSIO 60948]|nr:hypothetical protein HJD18_16900 [Thermoleophilia bacterium SCSIO 60948]
MLFDIRSGKRRRVVQVVFGFLAVLFAVSFIGFGIGGDVNIDPSSLFGGDGGDASTEAYEGDIEDAEAALAKNPRDEQALVKLATAHYLIGQQGLGPVDPQTQRASVTDEARAQFDQAFAAWDRYLKLKPKRIDEAAASQILGAYVTVDDFEGAAKTQQAIAEARPTTESYIALANYRGQDNDIDGVIAAASEATKLADGSMKQQLQKQLAQLKRRAPKIKRQIEQRQGTPQQAEDAIENPFGSLGGSSAAP